MSLGYPPSMSNEAEIVARSGRPIRPRGEDDAGPLRRRDHRPRLGSRGGHRHLNEHVEPAAGRLDRQRGVQLVRHHEADGVDRATVGLPQRGRVDRRAEAGRDVSGAGPIAADDRRQRSLLRGRVSAAGSGRSDMSVVTQRVARVDLANGRIRLPHPTKALFPAEKTRLSIVRRGKPMEVRYDPRLGPDRERSAVLGIGRRILPTLVREMRSSASPR